MVMLNRLNIEISRSFINVKMTGLFRKIRIPKKAFHSVDLSQKDLNSPKISTWSMDRHLILWNYLEKRSRTRINLIATSSTELGIVSHNGLLFLISNNIHDIWNHSPFVWGGKKQQQQREHEILASTMALIPPEETNKAAAWLDCRTAPSKSGGKQLKQKPKKLTAFWYPLECRHRTSRLTGIINIIIAPTFYKFLYNFKIWRDSKLMDTL